jgi:hypothetical protein
MRLTYSKFLLGAVAAFFITYLLALRPFTPEFYVDPYTYVNLATQADAESVEWVAIREPVFPVVLSVLGVFFHDGYSLYCVVQFLLIFFLVCLVGSPEASLIKHVFCVALIITVPACFVLYVNLWRQFIAVALVLIAIENRNYALRRNGIFILAMLTHLSCGLLVALYWLFSNSSIDGRRFRLAVVMAFALAMLAFGTISSALGLFSEYVGDGEGTLARRIYMIAACAVAAYFERDYFRRSLMVGLAVCVVSLFPNIIFDRMSHMPIMFAFVCFARGFRGLIGWLLCAAFIVVNSMIVLQTQSANTLLLGIFLGS